MPSRPSTIVTPARTSHVARPEASARGRSARPGPPLPPGLVILRSRSPPDVLLHAANESRRLGVRPETVLLGEGLVSEAQYYEALARWGGAPFFAGQFTPGPEAEFPEALTAGARRPPGERPPWVVAPRGERLDAFVATRSSGKPGGAAVATPATLRDSLIAACAPAVAEAAANGLARRDPDVTARPRARLWQTALAAAALAIAFLPPEAVGWAADLPPLAVTVVFCGGLLFRLAAVTASAFAVRAPPPRLADRDLPVYTVVAPLYRERAVAARLIAALDALDYPRSKLDIKLMVEEDDAETRDLLKSLDLAARYEIVVAPEGRPRTKPRALNLALTLARGDLLVVYDAEDEPEPGQLRLAAEVFAAAPDNVCCLQARLVIDNVDDGVLPKLFALEYAALFDVLNPGLAQLGLPIALGGTSNHFRTHLLRRIGGWDAWNVTEDIDLGLRIARHRMVVRALDSATHEEAPIGLGAWLRQRRRWFKGWMQTLIAHTRSPWRFAVEFGRLRALAGLLMLASALLAPLIGGGFFVATFYAALGGDLLSPGSLAALFASTVWCGVFAGGSIAALWPVFLGALKRDLRGLLWLLPLMPLYWLLLSLAAWWAALDYLRARHHWHKTEHGLARSSRRRRAR